MLQCRVTDVINTKSGKVVLRRADRERETPISVAVTDNEIFIYINPVAHAIGDYSSVADIKEQVAAIIGPKGVEGREFKVITGMVLSYETIGIFKRKRKYHQAEYCDLMSTNISQFLNGETYRA